MRKHTPRPAVAGDYEIGFARPPKSHRFRPGVSGNPKGRPRKAESLPALLRTMMREKVKVRVGDREQAMSTIEVMLRRQVEKVVKGDTRAFNSMMAMLAENAPDLLAEARSRTLASDDLKLLASFIRRKTTRGVV